MSNNNKVPAVSLTSDQDDAASSLSASSSLSQTVTPSRSVSSTIATSLGGVTSGPSTTGGSKYQQRSQGHDFYDDGYDDDDEPLNNRIIFDQSKFFGRKEELQILKDAYYDQLMLGRMSDSRSNSSRRRRRSSGNTMGNTVENTRKGQWNITSSSSSKKKKSKKHWSSSNHDDSIQTLETTQTAPMSSTNTSRTHSMLLSSSIQSNDAVVGTDSFLSTQKSSTSMKRPRPSSTSKSPPPLHPNTDRSSLLLSSSPQPLQTLTSNCSSSTPSSSTSTNVGPPVIVIEGFSGNGKSSLVRRFVEEITYPTELGNDVRNDYSTPPSSSSKSPVPIFMSGKYSELYGGDQPLSAILDALNHFFDGLVGDSIKEQQHQGDDEKHQRGESLLLSIQNAIRADLGDEIDEMTNLIPSLEKVMNECTKLRRGTASSGSSDGGSSASSSTSRPETKGLRSDGSSMLNRQRYIFGKLFGAISGKHRPLILFLDDLQWSDESSVELIESLLDDPSLRYVMFIGALRAKQKNKNPRLNSMLGALEERPEQYRTFTRIELLNLSIDELGEFVADVLSLTKEESESLTEIIYGKTRGNIFFSMQLIEELHRRNILYYSVISFQWEWNLKDVEFESTLSENVIAAVASKIASLPEKLQRALVLAAYTRSSIDVHTLRELMVADGYDIDFKELLGILDIAVLEGLLLNTVGCDQYRFAHDRIQQASYWMVPSGKERDELRITIGKKLVQLYSESSESKDWMVFVAADHLNSCTIHGQDMLELVQLNLICGTRAFKLAAFVPASLYLRLALKSLRRLTSTPWETHYDLSLRVYRGITDIELCLGNASGFDLGREILGKAHCFEDKIPTYLSLIRATGQTEQHAEAFTLCQEALFQLKAIPTRFRAMHLIKDILRTKRLFRVHSDHDILMLPMCNDEDKSIIMEFLTEYALRAHHCGKLEEYIFAIMRAVRMTFKYGLSGGSAHAFAGYGIFLLKTGAKGDELLRMANLARKILDQTDPYSRPTKALTLTAIAWFLEPWSQPRERVMETLQASHLSGMATGNMEMGFQGWALCNIVAQTTGYPLKPVEETAVEVLSQTKRYNVKSVVPFTEATRVVIQCLNGQRSVDWDELEPTDLSHVSIKAGDTYRCLFILLSRLEVGVYFDNPEFAVRMSDKLTSFLKQDGSFVGLGKGYFFGALAHIALARKCWGSNRTKARRLGKKLRNLCRTHGLNLLHKSLLVDAELLSTRSLDSAKLIVAYDSAIYAAIKMGCTHDAALGMELCGKTLLELGEENRGHMYLTQARDLWREYGAIGMVDKLLQQYGRKIDKVTLDTLETVGEHQVNSGDFGDSKTSLDLGLLSGVPIKTEIQMKFPVEDSETNRERQEEDVSILTDPSASGHLAPPPPTTSLTRAITT